MKTGKDTKKFQYVDRSAQLPGSHAEFPIRIGPANQKYNPHSSTYVVGEGSGSFTAQIDQYRQGVSVINDQLKAKAALPVADSAVLDLNFGESPGYLENGPFHDKPNFESVGATEGLQSLVEGIITTASFSGIKSDQPIFQAGKRYYVSDLHDGVADNFNVILKSFLPKILTRSLDPLGNDVTKGIKASLTFGNESYLRGVDPVQPLVPIKTFGSSPYVDKVAIMGVNPVDGNPSGSIALDNRVHSIGESLRYQEVYGPRPFDDSLFENRMFTVKQTSNMSNDMKSAIASNISGSTETIIPEGFKSARTGFIFTNNGLNVDSIAFGGLRNDA
jgi:hypothetical protein